MAVDDGNPQSTGDFTMAMRFKAGGRIPPHFRVVGPGGFAAIPAEAHHFEAGKTDAVVLLSGPGPLKTTMVKP
jgi:hypothetical protein